MRDEESGFDVTSVGVSPLLVEDLGIQVNVTNVDGIIKGECHHLGNSGTPVILRTQIARNFCTIFGTETVGKFAQLLVTNRSTVWVSISI